MIIDHSMPLSVRHILIVALNRFNEDGEMPSDERKAARAWADMIEAARDVRIEVDDPPEG
jgi:hypothetical protein